MEDLYAAATDAADKLEALEKTLGEAGQALAAIRPRLEAVHEGLETDWNALVDQVASYLKAVETQHNRLVNEGKESLEALVKVNTTVAEAATKENEEVTASVQVVAALGASVTNQTTPVTDMLGESEELVDGLDERAKEIDKAIDDQSATAREFLTGTFKTNVDELKDHVGALDDAAAKEFGEHEKYVAELMVGWEAALEQIENQVVSEGFETARAHLKEVVGFALGESSRLCTEAADALEEKAGSAAAALGSLAEAVTQGRTELGEAMQPLDEAMDKGQAGMEAASAALARVRQQLARYTFVDL